MPAPSRFRLPPAWAWTGALFGCLALLMLGLLWFAPPHHPVLAWALVASFAFLVLPTACALSFWSSHRSAEALVEERSSALQKNEELLQRISTMARVGAWELDLRTMRPFWSAETFRIHEVDSTETPPLDQAVHFFAPEAQKVIGKALTAAIEQGAPWDLELPLTTAKGRNIWVRTQSATVFEEGRAVKLQGAFHDITARKQAELERTEALGLLHKVADRLPGAVYQFRQRPNGRAEMPYANELLFKLFEAHPNEVQLDASKVFSAIHPDDIGEVMASIQRSARELTPWRHEFRVRHADGSIFWLFGNALPEREADGSTLWHGFVTDITGRKKTEMALRESVAFSKGVLDSISDQIAVLDAQGTILAINEAWRRFALENGAPVLADHSVGINYLQVCWEAKEFPEAVVALSAEAGIRAVLTGAQEEFSIDYPCHSPTQQRWFQMRATALKGGQRGAIIAHSNITERILAEDERGKLASRNQQLQKSESLSRMAGAVAHHFNNQLQAVMGNLELALQDLPPEAGPTRNLADAMQAARRAAQISGLMLTYLGQDVRSGEALDLCEESLHALTLLKPQMPQEIALELDLPTPGPVVMASARRIQQILGILLTNAWEATGTKGAAIRVSVKTTQASQIPSTNRYPAGWQAQEGSYVCLQVADVGCGIAAEHVEKLFDPFFSSKFVGRGLGLPTVLGIVRAYKGVIVVESEVGRGSVFRIYFPLAAQKLAPKPPLTGLPSELPIKGGVLVVDDEPTVRAFLAIALKRFGFTVFAAVDGQEAQELFRAHQNQIDCVLCDLSMPGMDGWETLTALRRLEPGIPVILASGYGEDQVMAGEHREKPQVFLKKPYELETLREALGQVFVNSE